MVYVHISTALIGLFFFALGGIYKNNQFKIDQTLMLNRAFAPAIFLISWLVICINFSTTLNFSNAEIGTGVYILINLLVAVLGIIALLLSSRLLKKYSLLSFLGSNTIPIIGFNYFVNGRLLDHFSSPVLLTIGNVLIFIVLILLLNGLGAFGQAISGKWQPYNIEVKLKSSLTFKDNHAVNQRHYS